jgi:hypothetical protein
MKPEAKGTTYFQKEEWIQQVKIKGEVTAIEMRSDKNGKPFYSVHVLSDGEEYPVKWNLFKIEKADGVKIGDIIVAHGLYYGPNKRLLKHIKIVETTK